VIRLYNYYRSGTSHRVRIALHLKDIPYEYVPVNLLEKEHKSATYLALNPQGLAPAIKVDGHILTQSPAILEWVEESWPRPPLLPTGRFDRARVRAMAALRLIARADSERKPTWEETQVLLEEVCSEALG